MTKVVDPIENEPPSKPKHMQKTVQFSFDDVKKLLCDACRVGLGDVYCDGINTHYSNGQPIRCTANFWRTDTTVLSHIN